MNKNLYTNKNEQEKTKKKRRRKRMPLLCGSINQFYDPNTSLYPHYLFFFFFFFSIHIIQHGNTPTRFSNYMHVILCTCIFFIFVSCYNLNCNTLLVDTLATNAMQCYINFSHSSWFSFEVRVQVRVLDFSISYTAS